MRIMALVEHAVAVLVLSLIVFGLLLALLNCVLATPKAVQSARMEPTLEMYRAFNLSPDTIRRHNAELEQLAKEKYERDARGGQ